MKKLILVLLTIATFNVFAEMTVSIYNPSDLSKALSEKNVKLVSLRQKGDSGSEPSIAVSLQSGWGSTCNISESLAKQNGFSLGELFLAINSLKSNPQARGNLNCWLAEEWDIGKQNFAKSFTIFTDYIHP